LIQLDVGVHGLAKKPKREMSKFASNAKYVEWLEPDGLIRIAGWAKAGLYEWQIAKNIGVSKVTLSSWKNRFPEINEALKRGREAVDFEVENAVFKRAVGYIYEDEEETIREVNGVTTRRVRKIRKHQPADVTAQIFWLNNRKPNVWRTLTDKQAKEAEARLRKIQLENEKLSAENELLKAQKQRLSEGVNTEFDNILREIMLHVAEEEGIEIPEKSGVEGEEIEDVNEDSFD
jgi:hypothetical protein